jgi:hypothetical protein
MDTDQGFEKKKHKNNNNNQKTRLIGSLVFVFVKTAMIIVPQITFKAMTEQQLLRHLDIDSYRFRTWLSFFFFF